MASLYLKHRPTELKDIVGNAALKKSLGATLSRDPKEIPHSYLMTGPSGCGKTTTGRIIASQLGAHHTEIHELDATDLRGIDAVRAIRQNLPLAPMTGRCKVYILDEVHQYTKDAQSALLKVLEDTPRHCYFILCTTDPQKLLPTLRNRCTTFKVDALKEKEVKALIESVLKAEGVEDWPTSVTDAIVDSAGGSGRAALVLLDKVIDMEDEEEMIRAAQDSALPDDPEAFAIAQALHKSGTSWKALAPLLKAYTGDAESARRVIIGYAQAVLLGGNPKAYFVLSAFREPTYDMGKPGLVLCCYEALTLGDG